MVTCTFCKIKRSKHINLGSILRKWKKVREPSVMIRMSNLKILLDL